MSSRPDCSAKASSYKPPEISHRKIRCYRKPLADARGSDQGHDRKGVIFR